jgi:hypothetical protein
MLSRDNDAFGAEVVADFAFSLALAVLEKTAKVEIPTERPNTAAIMVRRLMAFALQLIQVCLLCLIADLEGSRLADHFKMVYPSRLAKSTPAQYLAALTQSLERRRGGFVKAHEHATI